MNLKLSGLQTIIIFLNFNLVLFIGSSAYSAVSQIVIIKMLRRPINQSVHWFMKKSTEGRTTDKVSWSKLVPTKIVIKNKIKISSTFSHLIENANGSWLGSKLGKITPYQWVTDLTKKESLEIGLHRSAFVTKSYNNNSN